LGCFPENERCALACQTEGCPNVEPYDFKALQAMLHRVKQAFPEQEQVIVVVESSLSLGLQLAILGAVTRDGDGEPLFTEPIIAGGAG